MKSFSHKQKKGEPLLLAEQSPIFSLPGIGRRTATLLHQAGVQTIGSFVRLPDLLLEHTFGPSVPALRKHAAAIIAESSQQQFANFIRRVARQLIA